MNMQTKLMTSAEAMDKAGLNWKVLQTPVLFEGNGLKAYTGKVVNFRNDTGEALGIVGDGYKVVQNSTAFAFLDSLLGNDIERIERATSFRGGAVVSIRAKLPGEITFANNPDDKGFKYLDFYTGHDGSTALELSVLAWRKVCSNGLMRWDKESSATMKHTMNMSLDILRRRIGLAHEKFNIMESLSNRMAAQPFHRGKFGEVLEKIGMIPTESDRSTRARNIIDEVSRLFDSRLYGADFRGSRGTVWGAYNAVTRYVDHHRGSDINKRLESSMIGSGARLKANAMALLSAV